MVRVTHGICSNVFHVGGQPVVYVRESLQALYGVPEDAVSLVNGEQVGQDHVLQAEDDLDFCLEFGSKGVGNKIWTDAMQFCQDFKIEREDLDDWIAAGLRVYTCRDGGVRITETAVDEFLGVAPSSSWERLAQQLDRIEKMVVVSKIKETYTVEEAAVKLNKSPWVVRQWCNKGQVPRAYKIRTGRGKKGEWRIPHEAVIGLQNEGPSPLAE